MNKEKKIDYSHQIQQMFRYHYKERWVNQAFINRNHRLWIQAFNDLVKQGFIEKKKKLGDWKYRWAAKLPDV